MEHTSEEFQNDSYLADCDSPTNYKLNTEETIRMNRYAFGNKSHERDILNNYTTRKSEKEQ